MQYGFGHDLYGDDDRGEVGHGHLQRCRRQRARLEVAVRRLLAGPVLPDRLVLLDPESTRLESRHLLNSYSVFCFEKKKKLTNAEYDYITCDSDSYSS